MSRQIGTLTENSLHASVKKYLLEPGDLVEQNVDRFIVDILRNETIFEIQVQGFYKLKRKLDKLLDGYNIHLFHPIPKKKWIIRKDSNNNLVSKRKSPKKGQFLDIFQELIYIPEYLSYPNLTVEVLLIEQEDILLDDGQGSWRRKGWSLVDQKLVQVSERHILHYPSDYERLFTNLPEAFSNKDLSAALKCSRKSAQKITYTLSRSGLLQQNGKRGNENLYILSPTNGDTISK